MQTSRRQLNLEATRGALIEEARRQFALFGYRGAELSRIAAAAAVTTGAIYHHFGSKLGLFRAVAETLEIEILQAAVSVSDANPLASLRNGFRVLIDVCAAPDIQRITFIEAPQVLGPEVWREIELRYAFGMMSRILGGLEAAKSPPAYPADLVARLMLSLLRETSGAIASAGGDPAAAGAARALADAVLDALLGEGPRLSNGLAEGRTDSIGPAPINKDPQ